MKVSICITVFNEEKSISALLDSLLKQTKKPDEIVIVDGGSKDKTADIIKHYQKKDKRIKLIIEPGSIAHGRNTAVELAKYPIIAHIDAGCVAKKNWLEKITAPFKYKNVGLVAGFYHMAAKNSLQKAMNVYHGVVPKQFDPMTFLPSARSVAFRKSVWERVGGYSERLERAGEAIVEWREPATFALKDSVKKFYQYAKGDAQAGIWWHPAKQITSHNIKISLIFIRYLVGFVLFLLALKHPLLWSVIAALIILYALWAFRKIYIATDGDFKAGLWGIVLQFAADFSVMAGFIAGLFKKKV